MKRLSILFASFLILLTAAVPAARAAGNYYEGWDVPDDLAGWIANTVDASVVVVNAGGNPGGYIRSSRNTGGTFPIGVTTELAQASGDYAGAGVFEVSFDVMFEQGTFTAAAFRARYQTSTNNGWYFPFTADFTPGVWRSYVITFDPTWSDAQAMAAGWVSDGGPETFSQTFGDVYHAEVRISGTGEPLVAGVDNFRIRACPENTVVLDADFSLDTVGMAPDTTLPGSPLGDGMRILESSGTVTVESAVGTLTDHPILMDQVPGIGGLDAFFYPVPSGCDLVRVGWNSLARSNTITYMACVIRDPFGYVIAGVDYRPNGILTYNSVGMVGPALPVTYTPDVDQRFEILVDLATRTTSVAVDGMPLAGFQNVPFAEAAASGFGQLGFEGGGTGAQQFAIDNVVMTACDCNCDPDTVPPELEITLSPDVLWPPNHKMVEVCATVTTFDVCDPNPMISLESIVSSEDDNGLGDGNTHNDIQIDGDACFLLRAERSGLGEGRVYRVTYCATDAWGNMACAQADVTVPHDQSGSASPSIGYLDDGTGLQPEAGEYGIVVRSMNGFDVNSIDPERVFVGNHLGRIAPLRYETLYNEWYGRTDLRFFFPAQATLDLRGRGNKELVAFRYVTEDGTGWLVSDIFAMGPTAESTTGVLQSGDLRVGLQPALPNPFRASTEIRYTVTPEGPVHLAVFDVAGRKVRTLFRGTRSPGIYTAVWDGRNDSGVRMGAGIYFLKGDIVGHEAFERLVLLR